MPGVSRKCQNRNPSSNHIANLIVYHQQAYSLLVQKTQRIPYPFLLILLIPTAILAAFIWFPLMGFGALWYWYNIGLNGLWKDFKEGFIDLYGQNILSLVSIFKYYSSVYLSTMILFLYTVIIVVTVVLF